LKRLAILTLIAMGFVATAPCADAAIYRVQVRSNFYSPADITIHPFDGINFAILPGPFPHSVTADDGSFDSGLHQGPFIYRKAFTQVGDFPYYCTLHGAPGGIGMAGIIRVVPSEDD
jgi:plastocyanin